jgi:hypothetical protein
MPLSFHASSSRHSTLPEELPICALCRRADKNSPQERENQIAALTQSNEILLQVTRRAEVTA